MIRNLGIALACAVLAASCMNTESDVADAGAGREGAAASPTGDQGTVAAAPTMVPAGLVGVWNLIAVDGRPVQEVGKAPTLEIFENGDVGGLGGVNRFRTTVELSDGRLSFGPAAATKMAGPPEAMELESTFLARLDAISTYQLEGDMLRLWAGENEALTFKKAKR